MSGGPRAPSCETCLGSLWTPPGGWIRPGRSNATRRPMLRDRCPQPPWHGPGAAPHLPHVSGVEAVELEVPELMRRRGIDPFHDRAAVRRLVDEVVADYDERALTSTLPPLADTRQAARVVYDAVAGFGPLQRHLDDKDVEEIWINERLTGWWTRSTCCG